MAQRFPDLFDGIVAMSPAIMWDRCGFSGGFGNYYANQYLGQNGLDTAKFQDVNQRALAACDPLDGLTDGMIQEERVCTYNAKSAVCGQPGASTNPALCLTPLEAATVNNIWEGPNKADGT
jgi:feruloyl esterase